ncbi:MAG TPA: DUF1810 domain-containing protein [Ramlibacter sp.]
MNDRYDLQRFVDAQEPVYPQVLAELRAARKASHWMWFVFPQLAGLGGSPMARRYAISSLDEARAYLAHPVLGLRLRECSELVLRAAQPDVHRIFGSPDDLKFRSCMTLFQRAAPREPVFGACLDRYFRGEPDERTLALVE